MTISCSVMFIYVYVDVYNPRMCISSSVNLFDSNTLCYND